MKTASQLFSESQKQQVNQAVRDAEKRTSAEIVPVVATASGRYDRPEDVAGLWVAIIGVIVAWRVLPAAQEAPGSWGGWSHWYNLGILLAVIVTGFVLGAAVASRIHWLRRLFTSRKEMADEVAARAAEVFTSQGVFRTKGATGLVVYISLFERLARIQADRAVVEKLGMKALEGLAASLVERLRGGDLPTALSATIAAAGEQLAAVLPRLDDDTDELPNELVLLD
jgi:putative membrane protein